MNPWPFVTAAYVITLVTSAGMAPGLAVQFDGLDVSSWFCQQLVGVV